MADPDIAIVEGFPIPMAPPAPSAPVMMQQDDAAVMRVLAEQGYTHGLAQALATNKRAFALAVWIVDNSGSMQTRDGHRIVEGSSGAFKFVECSRWAEMQQTVEYHAQMAALMCAPTTFRLLNDPGCIAGPQIFSIANGSGSTADQDLEVALKTMRNALPTGVTPLTQHVQAIREHIIALQSQLHQNGTKVAIVLATDGLPTDAQGYSNSVVKQEFVDTLRSLEGLPVWIVVRLCTDEDAIVEYWNALDAQLELSLEVLDDFVSEAAEVHKENPWLNYGLPLHRMREMGFHHSLFDLLDERKLSRDEVRGFMSILFGLGLIDEAPDPDGDWKGFSLFVGQLVAKEKKQWDAVHKKMMPWIDMKKLNKEYGSGGLFGRW
jgi:Mg-chelatase subunit ChlD